MKNWIKRLLPLAALFLLASCGGRTASEPYNPAETAELLQNSGAFSDVLEALDQETAAAYYGLEEDTIQDCAVYTSLSLGAEELAVFAFSDSSSAEDALELLRAHVDSQKAVLKDYRPDDISKLDNAILEQRENSVLLVVAADASAAQCALDSLDKAAES